MGAVSANRAANTCRPIYFPDLVEAPRACCANEAVDAHNANNVFRHAQGNSKLGMQLIDGVWASFIGNLGSIAKINCHLGFGSYLSGLNFW